MSEATGKKPRGRPRPLETQERDAKILAYLVKHGPQTRNDLAEKLELEKMKTWLALNRLRNEGKVRRCAGHAGTSLWLAEGEKCP